MNELRIGQLRKQVGLTQGELAERCETTQQQIAKIETGIVDPRVSTLERLAKALGCSPAELFYSKIDFLRDVNAVAAQEKINFRKVDLLQFNHLCAEKKGVPSFHPFWEKIEIKNNKVTFKEKKK